MTPDGAASVSSHALRASAAAEDSLLAVMATHPVVSAHAYRRLVGRFMGYLYTNVLAGVWHEHPSLEPPSHSPSPSEAPPAPDPGHNALAALAIAKKELSEVRAVFAREHIDPESWSRYGGINEIESVLVKMVAFVTDPPPEESAA